MLDEGVLDEEEPPEDDDGVVVDVAEVAVSLAAAFASLFSPDDELFAFSVGGFILSE